MAAYAPYVARLAQASADSAATAADHITHTMLVATNFFGINTIPIALDKAENVRIWIQATTTMSVYEAVTDAALVSTPHTSPAPVIVEPGVGPAGDVAGTTQSGSGISPDDLGLLEVGAEARLDFNLWFLKSGCPVPARTDRQRGSNGRCLHDQSG
ncbi:PPE family protein [Mycobacterium decipiens]|uniref:PPE family protein n=1 Tax=Mycobacterium decipiens TaxID=1430326 RepID=UPI0026C9CA69